MNSYFETYDLWNVVLEERSSQTFSPNPINIQIKAFLEKAKLVRVFFQHKIERRKKKLCYENPQVQNAPNNPQAQTIQQQHTQ